jgi:shikimate kinase
MNITLIGMAGAGKSTIGKKLAAALNYKFIDIDKLIEQKAKQKLADIILNKGEKIFKDIEEKAVLGLKNINDAIISPGGSIIYSEKVMQFLKKISVVVFLDVPFESIQKRLTGERIKCIIGIKKKNLRELFEERLALYKKYADIIVEPTDIDYAVSEIMRLTKP